MAIKNIQILESEGHGRHDYRGIHKAIQLFSRVELGGTQLVLDFDCWDCEFMRAIQGAEKCNALRFGFGRSSSTVSGLFGITFHLCPTK